MIEYQQESFRLAKLAEYDLLGTPPERDYDQLVDLAAHLFSAPISLISLVGKSDQWFKAHFGLEACGSDRSMSFCAHTLNGPDCLVVLDAKNDPRFGDNPLVTGAPHIRFYAGAPLIDAEGVHLGALCVIDTQPRQDFSDECRRLLHSLAALVITRFEKRRATRSKVAVGNFAEATELAIITSNEQGVITSWNRAAQSMFGHAPQDVLGKSIQLIIPGRFRREHATGMLRASLPGNAPFGGKTVEVVALRKDGSEFPVEINIAKWQGPNGCEFGAHISDISERRAHETRLHQLAYHDVLTGLLNRASFRERIELALVDGRIGAVLALDMDGFKAVNDGLGHPVGDDLLQMAALRMRAALENDCDLARVGGDEFSILVPSHYAPDSIDRIAERVLQSLREPFELNGHAIDVRASAGVAVVTFDDLSSDELLSRADVALLAAKARGGNCAMSFTMKMKEQIAARRLLNNDLRLAVDRKEWRLFYQPQVRLTDGKLIGVEALLRWQHTERGLLYPDSFIDTLSTHLVSYEIGCWVLDEACRQLAAWRTAGIDVPRIAVNLFASQVRAGTLKSHISLALQTHSLKPHDLELEITEIIALQQDDEVLESLHELRALGVYISFDDFGTGFASLSNLKQFPVSGLKIDKIFVRDVCDEPHSAAVVAAIVSIGSRLDIEVIAEGVETELQRNELLKLGCKGAQGYLFGKPYPAGMLTGSPGA